MGALQRQRFALTKLVSSADGQGSAPVLMLTTPWVAPHTGSSCTPSGGRGGARVQGRERHSVRSTAASAAGWRRRDSVRERSDVQDYTVPCPCTAKSPQRVEPHIPHRLVLLSQHASHRAQRGFVAGALPPAKVRVNTQRADSEQEWQRRRHVWAMPRGAVGCRHRTASSDAQHSAAQRRQAEHGHTYLTSFTQPASSCCRNCTKRRTGRMAGGVLR